jgi:hypothetical protein
MTTPPPTVVNNVYATLSLPDRIAYLRVACFSPVQDMWINAIENGNFATWPGLTAENVHEHLPKSDTMVNVQLNQQRQHIRSKQPPPDAEDPTVEI